jgi:serine protease Do
MVVGVSGQEVKSVADLRNQIAKGVSSVSISREGLISTIQFR